MKNAEKSEGILIQGEKKKPRRWRRRLLGMLMCLSILFIGLEVGSFILFGLIATDGSLPYKYDRAAILKARADRLEQIDDIFNPSHKNKTAFIQHPYLGFAGRTGRETWLTPGQVYNSWGFSSTAPGPWPYKRANDSEIIIGVLGGSVASNWAWWALDNLSLILKSTNPAHWEDHQLTIVSLANPGYKQPQQLFALQMAILAGFEFDIVINLDGFNEIALGAENIIDESHPLWPSSSALASLMVIQNRLDRETLNQMDNIYENLEREEWLLKILSLPPFRWSAFANTFGAMWTQRSRNVFDTQLFKLNSEFRKGLDEVFRGPLTNAEITNAMPLILGIWRESSIAIHQLCEAHGIKYLHALQPNQYLEGTKPLSDEERRIAISPDHKWGKTARAHYNSLVSEGASIAEQGIEYIDLTSVFMNTEDIVYLDDCCHVNMLGNQIMGEAIAARLDEIWP